jgi:two-component sensor histidine kinase/PAS domain-containing protein
MQGETSIHPIEVEYRMRHKDGSWRWLLSRDRVFAYTPEGKPKQILGVATDITYLKEIQIALAESEARFRSLANNLPGAVLRYVLHPDGTNTLHYISPGCEKLWEVDVAAALTDVRALWRLVLPEDVPAMGASIAHSAQTLSTWYHEWRIQTPSGQQKWLSGIGEPHLLANGDVVWDTIILDASDRRRSQEELERLVADRTQSLMESQKFLRQQLEREKLLLAVTNRIRSSMELPDILDRTVAEIQELLGCDRVVIYKILEDGSGVTITEARVPTYSSFLGMVFSPEVLPEGVQQAYKAGRIAALRNSEGLSPCMVEFMHRYQIRSKLVVPLLVGSDLWGLVVMQHCAQDHTWEDWEMDLMSQLSVSLAVAIRQSELFDRAQSELQARRQAEAALQSQAAADRLLAQIAQRIGQSPYLAEVLDSTLETLRQFLQADRVVVYRFLPNWSGIVECEAVRDPRLSLAGQEICDPCFANAALQQRYQRGEVDAVADVVSQGDACYQHLMAQLQVRAKLVAPILQGDRLWGLAIAHDCQQVRRWTSQETQLLAQVATQIGIAGQQEKLFARIQQELQQKETLLKEVHHRVKNNLQIVTSLMRLQVDRHQEPALQVAFLEGQNRIQAMALIHERLYRSDDLSRIDAQTYFAELTQYLGQTYNAGDRRITLHLQVASIHLGIDQAIPCGLIVNELVSNAFKYAFGEEGGTITVALGVQGDSIFLRVADNGCGLPANFDGRRSPSLGLRLVDRLVRQLSGKLLMRSNPGADFTVCFPWHP